MWIHFIYGGFCQTCKQTVGEQENHIWENKWQVNIKKLKKTIPLLNNRFFHIKYKSQQEDYIYIHFRILKDERTLIFKRLRKCQIL